MCFSLIGVSCGASSSPDSFSIIGKWGMRSGTITNPNGTTDRYADYGPGQYYQTIEYKVDGTYIETTMPNKNISYGTYTYNSSNQSLSYKLDTDQYYVTASVTIITATEMNVFTNWGASIGSVTQYFVKI